MPRPGRPVPTRAARIPRRAGRGPRDSRTGRADGEDAEPVADGRGREDEHGGHAERVRRHQRVGEVAAESGGLAQYAARRGAGPEHGGHEDQSAAQEDGGDESVLGIADPRAQGAHEPQEEDPREREDLQSRTHRPLFVRRDGLVGGVPRGDGDPHQHDRRRQQEGEHRPRQSGGARCPQPLFLRLHRRQLSSRSPRPPLGPASRHRCRDATGDTRGGDAPKPSAGLRGVGRATRRRPAPRGCRRDTARVRTSRPASCRAARAPGRGGRGARGDTPGTCP